MTDSEIDVQHKRVGRQGTVILTIITPDAETFTDKLDITKESVRAKFLERVAARLGPAVFAAVAQYIEQIASTVVEENAADDDEKGQADELVALASEAYLFHTPGGYDSEGYAAINVDEHRETWAIGSRPFKRWLAKQYHDAVGRTPKASAIDDALTIIAGKAIYEGAEHEVTVRLTGNDTAIYVDLCDAKWNVVVITATGWTIVPSKDAPVWFVRKHGSLPLPHPVKGGSITDLRPLLNLADETNWVLFVGCLVGYLRPVGPYPILTIEGEHGSAKSTACRFVVRIIDPKRAALRRPPKSERDLMIAASNSWLVGYDNLSGIADWLSDTICSLATGGGFGARQLYSDDNEKLFDAMRPVVMNGIDRIATRSDLLDRAVHLHLPCISEEQRVLESDLGARFEAALPGVLGALFDAVSSALLRRGTVKLDRLPRMADFAMWVVAAEPALGWAPGTFIGAYTGNRAEANEAAVAANATAPLILALLAEVPEWLGTAGELLARLDSLADDKTRNRKDWPETSESMAKALRRIAPNLRALGLTIEFLPRQSRSRPIHITRGTYRPHCDSSSSASDSAGGSNCHTENGPGDPANAVCDSSDGSDSFAGASTEVLREWTA